MPATGSTSRGGTAKIAQIDDISSREEDFGNINKKSTTVDEISAAWQPARLVAVAEPK